MHNLTYSHVLLFFYIIKYIGVGCYPLPPRSQLPRKTQIHSPGCPSPFPNPLYVFSLGPTALCISLFPPAFRGLTPAPPLSPSLQSSTSSPPPPPLPHALSSCPSSLSSPLSLSSSSPSSSPFLPHPFSLSPPLPLPLLPSLQCKYDIKWII